MSSQAEARAPIDAGAAPLAMLAELFGLAPVAVELLSLAVSLERGEPEPAGLDGPLTLTSACRLIDGLDDEIAPDAALRSMRLVAFHGGGAARRRPLHVPESVLGFLDGVPTLDPALRPYTTLLGGEGLPDAAAMSAANAFAEAARDGGAPAMLLDGADVEASRDFARAVAATLGLNTLLVEPLALGLEAHDLHELAACLARDAALLGAALLIEPPRPSSESATAAAWYIAEHAAGVVMVADRSCPDLARRDVLRLPVPAPDVAAREGLWREALAGVAPGDQRDRLATEMAGRHRMGGKAIVRAVADAQVMAAHEPLRARLHEVCALPGRRRLAALADRIEPRATFDDLILPEGQRQLLAALIAHARGRERVLRDWGFGDLTSHGSGVSALFTGPSGVGKSMAAEVVAGALERDLFRVDLAATVSKYIGETEQNLARIFDLAESSGAVLLFDECDALFGRRGEVRDAHDRYANLEVSYLLQRIESYDGVAVMTSNLKEHVDQAFLRRLRFVLRFPFPDAKLREAIWRRAIPPAAPCATLDFEKLARLQATGGQIRNIALTAALLAYEADGEIGMALLARAAQLEFAKLDRAPAEAELRGWVS